MHALIRPVLACFVVLSILTGIAYPLAVTGIARFAFPLQTAGSLVHRSDQVVGSALIGQNFSDPRHFWGRPSATGPFPYNAAASGGSNQGPLNPALADAVKSRVEALKTADPGNTGPIPVDLVTASASGIDPDISIAAALYQVPRVSRLRGLSQDRVGALIEGLAQGRIAGFLGEPRINVLKLNLALDALTP